MPNKDTCASRLSVTTRVVIGPVIRRHPYPAGAARSYRTPTASELPLGEATQTALRTAPPFSDAGHAARGLAAVQLGQQCAHVTGGTFGDDLNPAVVQVGRGTGQAERGRLHPDPVPEADALDPAVRVRGQPHGAGFVWRPRFRWAR